MKRHWIALLLMAVCAGCFGSKAPQRRFYTLNISPLEPPRNLRFPGVVRVRNLDPEAAYDRFQIVVRRSPFELEYRQTHVWAVKPNRAIADLIARSLIDMKLFTGVTRELTEQRPDFVFSGDLHAIEIYDSGDVWFAHLGVTFTLNDFHTGERLWTYAFDQRKEVTTLTFSHASRALSELLTQAVGQAMRTLAVQHGVEPPPAPTPEESATPEIQTVAPAEPEPAGLEPSGESEEMPEQIFVPESQEP